MSCIDRVFEHLTTDQEVTGSTPVGRAGKSTIFGPSPFLFSRPFLVQIPIFDKHPLSIDQSGRGFVSEGMPRGILDPSLSQGWSKNPAKAGSAVYLEARG